VAALERLGRLEASQRETQAQLDATAHRATHLRDKLRTAQVRSGRWDEGCVRHWVILGG
jgi:hypothetical protein